MLTLFLSPINTLKITHPRNNPTLLTYIKREIQNTREIVHDIDVIFYEKFQTWIYKDGQESYRGFFGPWRLAHCHVYELVLKSEIREIGLKH